MFYIWHKMKLGLVFFVSNKKSILFTKLTITQGYFFLKIHNELFESDKKIVVLAN